MYAATGGPNVKLGGADFKWGAGHHWRRPWAILTKCWNQLNLEQRDDLATETNKNREQDVNAFAVFHWYLSHYWFIEIQYEVYYSLFGFTCIKHNIRVHYL